ncbi:MAG: hypothetical protein IT457_01700 [Planctomycetes bacterium]|nr:hypothetical protein [Planctomycetota bacterium]
MTADRATPGPVPGLTVLALLAACGAPQPAPDASRARLEGRAAVALVHDQVLTLLARHPDGRESPVAELRSLRFDAGDRPQDLPFRSWTRDGDTLRLEVASPVDHELSVELTFTADAALQVRVVDRIRARARITELGLVWWAVQQGRPDEVEAPLVHPEPDALAGDAAFRAPIAFVRHGELAFAVLPDLDSLAAERPLPQALSLDAGERTAIRHTLIGQSFDAVFGRPARDPAAGRTLRGELLELRHTIRGIASSDPDRILRSLRDELWLRHATPRLTGSADPLQGESFDGLAGSFAADLVARRLKRAGRDGREQLAVLDPLDAAPDRELFRFGASSNALADAVALARLARRLGRDDWRRQASQVTAFALAAPRRSGLIPHALLRTPSTGSERWSPGDPDGPQPLAFAALDAARTGLFLLELASLQPEHRDAIRGASADLARFFADNQASDGSIPAFFDATFLRPLPRETSPPGAAAAGPAAFLARWSAWTGDAAAGNAARRALGHLAESALPARSFADPSREAIVDRRSGLARIDLLPLALAAIAAVELAGEDAAYRVIATRLLDELAGLQQLWDPPWIPIRSFGGFTRSNADCIWNDGDTALAAEALLDGYRVLGRRLDLERGVAALRSAMVAPAPYDAVLATRADPTAALGSAVACAERVRERLGQIVVELDEGWALGIDGVTATLVTRDAGTVGLRVTSTGSADEPFLLRAPHGGAVPSRVAINGIEIANPAALIAGAVPVTARRLPRLEFRPPHTIPSDSAWQPVLRWHGVVPDEGSVRFVVQTRGRRVVLPTRVEDDGLLAATVPLSTHGMSSAEVLFAHAELEVDGFVTREPMGRPRKLRIGTMSAIDPGDDLELDLVVASDGTRVMRFVDGREFARQAEPGQHFVYRLAVPSGSSSLELRLRVAGALSIRDRDGGRLLLESSRTDHAARDVELQLADPRLWSTGDLLLVFEPATDEAIEVARMEYRAIGSTPTAADAGKVVDRRDPEPSIHLSVVPLVLRGERERTIEALEQAVFGGEEYRITPEPEPRASAGSLARYVDRISGGRTALRGAIAEPLVVDLGLEAIAAGEEAALEALRDAILAAARRAGPGPLDVVLALYSGSPHADLEGQRIETPGELPIVLCAERETDGSFLSCGRLAYRVLGARFDFVDLSSPAEGNFGELALGSLADGHAAAAPAGPNLLRAGWATLVDVAHDPQAREVKLAPSVNGRSMLLIDVPPLDRLGAALLETIAPRNERDSAGLAVTWELNAGHEPTLALLDGRRVRPQRWRIPSQGPAVRSPFEPGTSATLFRAASRLDGRSTPPLATPTGEAPWQIDNLRLDASGTASFSIRWLGVDVLRLPIAWRAGDAARLGPVPTDGRDRGVGAVALDADGLRLALPDRRDAVLHASVVMPASQAPLRWFARLAAIRDGSVEFKVLCGGRELLRTELDGDACELRVDLPGAASSDGIELVCRRLTGAPVLEFAYVVAVPRSGTEGELRLTSLPVRTITAADGSRLGGARSLTLDGFGRASLREAAIVPPGHGTLRLAIARPAGAQGRLRLQIEVREAAGPRRSRVLDGYEFAAGQGLELLIVELPHGDEQHVGFVEFAFEGTPGESLAILEATLLRG